ncbi:MAG: cell division protein ZapA [Parasphingopyxis sp.]|uniref:cell division protein ZapA n=1 Tax=Parasphingopyxis sp. TaxID=1920299 RepID=UPI003FA0D36D
MAEVHLSIAGHNYTVACRDGEEARLTKLGEMVDAKTSLAQESVGGNLSEVRVLLFAALLLADEADELRTSTGLPAGTLDDLEKLADRLTALGDDLASDAGRT